MTFETLIRYMWVVQTPDGEWLRWRGQARGGVPRDFVEMVGARPELELCCYPYGMCGCGDELSFVPLDAEATFCKCCWGSKPWQHYWLQNYNSSDGRLTTFDLSRLRRWVEEFDLYMSEPLSGLTREVQAKLFVENNRRWF